MTSSKRSSEGAVRGDSPAHGGTTSATSRTSMGSIIGVEASKLNATTEWRGNHGQVASTH